MPDTRTNETAVVEPDQAERPAHEYDHESHSTRHAAAAEAAYILEAIRR